MDSLPLDLNKEFSKLTLLSNRTQNSTNEEKAGAFANLSTYRDGAVYIGYFNGSSDWERHTSADEIVYIFEGTTKLFVKSDTKESSFELNAGQLVIVPQGAWHRFETDGPIKSLTITPMPTDHSIEYP